LQLAWRTADDTEDLGSRRLLLQRLPQLVEQARVLDGDDGLRCEILNQLNLLVGKWADLLTVDVDCANQFIIFEHWHAKNGANTPAFDSRHEHRIMFCIPALCPSIFDLRYLLRPRHTRKDRFRTRPNRFAPNDGSVIWRHTLDSCNVKGITIVSEHLTKLGLT